MEHRKGFIFYRSFYEAISELPRDNQCDIIKAIMDYSFLELEPQLEGINKTIWILIKPQLEANNRRFENGNKPKKKSKNEAKTKQDKSKNEAKEKEKEKELINNINIINIEDDKKTIFEKTLGNFVLFRNEIKKPIKETSKLAFIEKLKKLGNNDIDTMVEILNQSIANGWQGIFPLDNKISKITKKENIIFGKI